MKKALFFMLATILFQVSAAHAGPVEDRRTLLDHYRKILPKIRFEDYVYGALSMDASAKSQYDDIMSFPPFSIDVDEGQKLWEKPFRNGRSFSSCFPDPKGANAYPYYDTTSHRVVTFENAVNACLEKNGEKPLEYGGLQMGRLTSYAKSLSDGMKVDVRVEGKEALSAYHEGKRYYYAKRGKQGFSCASCHVDNAGKVVHGDRVSMMIGQATHYPEFIAGTELLTLQQRFQNCAKNAGEKPLKIDSEEYNDLEYFMTYMSDGLPMQTPVFRK